MNNYIKIGSFSILILSSIAMFIFLITKYNRQKTYQKGYQYIYNPKDITTQNELPITKTFNNIDKCIEACEDNPNCSGLTFNTNKNTCSMITRGLLVEGQENHIGWEKKNKEQEISLDTLVSRNPSNSNSIPNKSILKGLSSEFGMAFTLNIIDFYDAVTDNSDNKNNSKIWKHILHKGKINSDKYIPHSDKWEEVIKDGNGVYEQDIGFWLAPYTNNIRVCFTITNIVENMNEKNDQIVNNIQYIDIQNVPINKYFLIAVNINNNIVEIFLNDKIHTMTVLNGNINISNEDIHIKYKPFFDGEIKNIHFIPEYSSYENINKIYNESSDLINKFSYTDLIP